MADMANVGGIVPYPDMDEEEITKIRAGFSLFEIRLPGRKERETFLFGPVDVMVREVIWPNQTSKLEARFKTGDDASIMFKPDKKGVSVAWMVDDRYWHNRVCLMDNPKHQAISLRTRDYGILTKPVIDMQLACLAEVLKEKIPVWIVTREGVDISGQDGWKHTKAEAEKELTIARGMKKQKVTLDSQGQLITIPGEEAEYAVQESVRVVYKKEIQEMVVRHHRLRFGWMECTKFQEEYKPQVMKLIEDRMKAAQGRPEMQQINIVQALLNASPEDRAAVKKLLLADSGVPESAPMPSTAGNALAERIYRRDELQKMSDVKLTAVCNARSLRTTGATADMINAILEDQNSKVEKVT